MRDYQTQNFKALSIEKVLIVQGYDPDGDYWGNPSLGTSLYRIFEKDGDFVLHLQAKSIRAARHDFLLRFPDANFAPNDDAEMVREMSWTLLADRAASEDNAIEESCRAESQSIKEGFIQRFGNLALALEPHLQRLDSFIEECIETIDRAWVVKLRVRDLYYGNDSIGLEECPRDAWAAIASLFGYGISPWDNLDPEDFGLKGDELPSDTEPDVIVFNVVYDVVRDICLPELFEVPVIPSRDSGSESSFDLLPWLENHTVVTEAAHLLLLAPFRGQIRGSEDFLLVEAQEGVPGKLSLYEAISLFYGEKFSSFEIDLRALRNWISA